MNNNWYKKEKPLLGLTGLGGGSDSFAVVSGEVKTYMDDLFSTFLYKGNKPSTQSINNGIDLSTEGGLVWIKSRTNSYNNILQDTVATGATSWLQSNTDGGTTNTNQYITSFNTNGFSLGTDNDINNSSQQFSSWSFRKATGFFDIVTWTGNGSGPRSISHNLGSVPGLIAIKRTNGDGEWLVFHSSLDVRGDAYLRLNQPSGKSYNSAYFGGVFQGTAKPTATSFNIGTSNDVNGSGNEYVAYIFAGGKSTTDRAVDFDGSGDYLSIPDSTAWDIGTNYTAECFFNIDALTGAGWDAIFGQWPGNNNDSVNTWTLEYVGTDLRFYYNDASTTVQYKSLGTVSLTEWHHFAFSKEGSTTRLFVDGEEKQSFTISLNAGNGSFNIGGNVAGGGWINGKVSNVRITKDQALYTTNFNVPSDLLTTTSQGAVATNVKLLCCNGSTTTSSTVTPGTITANGSPTTQLYAIGFDDTTGYIYGNSGNQKVISAGSYIGNGSTSGPEINLGWEPQWVIIKRADSTGNWQIYDSMRGIVTGGDDPILNPNNSNAESYDIKIELTPRGFRVKTSSGETNASGSPILYMAIRRPDPLVQKSQSATDVFAMDTGSSSAYIPSFDSNFIVDMAFARHKTASNNWSLGTRLTQGEYVDTNLNNGEATWTAMQFDSNVGWGEISAWDTSYQSWMWKRHAGFDVVTYEGSGVDGRILNHSLNQVPEMIWIKNRSTSGNTGDWMVGHKDLNGGSSPWNYYLVLNKTQAEYSDNNPFNNSTPTTTSFEIDSWDRVNASGSNYQAMLFSSVAGVSKVGSFSGVASASYPLSVTTGFAPRFILIKARSGTSGYGWFVWDSLRYSGNDNLKMALDSNNAQDSGTTYQYFDDAPISSNSTGFSIVDDGWGSTDTLEFIYYAHA